MGTLLQRFAMPPEIFGEHLLRIRRASRATGFD
jgi:hypothetical protein